LISAYKNLPPLQRMVGQLYDMSASKLLDEACWLHES